MTEQEVTRLEFINTYKEDGDKLFRYIPWLEGKSGRDVSQAYRGEASTVMSFSVYDSTLMEFVKLASKTKFMDKNYPYVYSRLRVRSHEDERKLIDSVKKSRDLYIVNGIFSKYVLEGMRKSVRWTEAVEEQIFIRVLYKLQDMLRIY